MTRVEPQFCRLSKVGTYWANVFRYHGHSRIQSPCVFRSCNAVCLCSWSTSLGHTFGIAIGVAQLNVLVQKRHTKDSLCLCCTQTLDTFVCPRHGRVHAVEYRHWRMCVRCVSHDVAKGTRSSGRFRGRRREWGDRDASVLTV